MEIIVIAAMASNRVIGQKNRIPWHLPDEMERFRETTWGHPVIMGRKTHESIGRPLPGRRNIVITRNPKYSSEGCVIVHSLQQAYALCAHEKRVFIIGGEQLYQKGLKDADTLILTILKQPVPGDTFFPEFSEKEFTLAHTEEVASPVPYSVNTYHRIRSRSDSGKL